MTTPTGYSRAQIALHWMIALLIGVNYIVSDGMGRMLDARLDGTGTVMNGTATVHVYGGIAVLVLVLARIVVRFRSGAPAAAGTGLMDRAAKAVHLILYALMLLVPVLGITAWFGGIDTAAGLHVLAMNAMMLLILLHAAAALLHQFVLKDGLLVRMLRAG